MRLLVHNMIGAAEVSSGKADRHVTADRSRPMGMTGRISASLPARGPGRAAFTIVELLTTIAILALLFALLIPAVNTARESSRMASCSSRLRKLALASNHFEMQRGHFPPSTVGSGHCILQPGIGLGYVSFPSERLINMNGLVLLLPFLDQMTIYNAANRESSFCNDLRPPTRDFGTGRTIHGNYTTNGNDAINRTVLPDFVCPTASHPRIYRDICGWGAMTNYDFVTDGRQGGSHGCNLWGQWRKDPRPCPLPGDPRNRTDIYSDLPRCQLMLSGDESDARVDEILDGLSNVLMFAETTSGTRCNGRDSFWSFRLHASYGVDPRLEMNNWVFMNIWEGACRLVNGQPANPCCNAAEPSRPLVVVGRQNATGSAGSEHPRGAWVAMADGAVRFVDESIAPRLRLQLARIADGNSPSLDP